MDKELTALIENFNKVLDEAKDARAKVMDYLEENYNIDTTEKYETIVDKFSWCDGIETKSVEKLIDKNKEEQ